MTPNLDALDNVNDLFELIHIAQPDGTIVVVEQGGTMYLGDGLYLKEVLYTPNFKCNLISVQKLAQDENCIIIYGVNFCILQDFTSRKLIGIVEMRNGVYYFKMHAGGTSYVANSTKESNIWHQRLGHPSFGSWFIFFSNGYGFQLNKDVLGCCDVCHKAKQTRSPFPTSDSTGTKPFSLIHCD